MKVVKGTSENLNEIDFNKNNFISEEELKSLQGLIKSSSNIEAHISRLAIENNDALLAYNEVRASLNNIKSSLSEKYGDVKIDMTTGEINESNESDNEKSN